MQSLPGPGGCHPPRLAIAGMSYNKKASDDLDGPAGSSTQQPPSPRLVPIVDDTGPPSKCRFCDRFFPTLRGRGVHSRTAHPNEQDRANKRVLTKVRWSEEEAPRMARREAMLSLSENPPSPHLINQALNEYFPDRTVESIKGQRRNMVYCDAVQLAIEELRARNDVSSSESQESSASEDDNLPLTRDAAVSAVSEVILRALTNLRQPCDVGRFGFRDLSRINDGESFRGKTLTLVDLSVYLDSVFPNIQRLPARSARDIPDLDALSARRRRRRDYTLTQRNSAKHQGRCIKSILDGDLRAEMPQRDVMEGFWRNIFESASDRAPRVNPDWTEKLDELWLPISLEDIRKSEPSMSTSPSFDGISARQWRAISSTRALSTCRFILSTMINLIC